MVLDLASATDRLLLHKCLAFDKATRPRARVCPRPQTATRPFSFITECRGLHSVVGLDMYIYAEYIILIFNINQSKCGFCILCFHNGSGPNGHNWQ